MNPTRLGHNPLLRVPIASALAFTLLVLSGCFSSSSDDASPDGEAKELKGKDAAKSADTPETELLVTSKKLYQSSMYTVSRDSLQSLQERYPMGAYGTFAAIKLADSYFFNREYIQASKLYEEFIKSYPGSPDLPYVKLQAARSNAFSARGTGRDRSPLEKALVFYDELADRYPATEYGKVAEAERRTVVQQLADYDRLIIDFYVKRENADAAAARQKLFDERWGSRLKAVDAPVTSSEKALEELKIQPLAASPVAELAAAPEEPQAPPLPASEAETYAAVQRVECFKEDPPYVVIEVAELPVALRGSVAAEQIKPRGGAATISQFRVKAEQPIYDCFAKGDLRFTADGDIVLKTKSEVLVTAVDNPARIILTFTQKLRRKRFPHRKT
jgi:outer membrane assembly lipoprotein YfiO